MNGIAAGLFICDCGERIASILDTEALERQARALPGVAIAQRLRYSCSPDGLDAIREAIATEKLNRVIVAGCTPRTLAPRFRRACREAGLADDLFELIDIREGCAWVHCSEPERATAKALDLLRIGLARVAERRPRQPSAAEVVPAALVIGGGPAGLTAALILAEAGVPVTLIERRAELGGMPDQIAAVRGQAGIRLLLQSRVTAVAGTVGRYAVTVAGPQGDALCEVGAIVVATGAHILPAEGNVAGGNGHAAALAPQPDAGVLAHLLHLAQDEAGYFPQVRHRLRPENYVERGIYVCGATHAPAAPAEAEFQALSAAFRALRHLRSGGVCSQAPVIRIDEALCTGCGTCVGACPYEAIALRPRASVLALAQVDALLCKGCGNCLVACPTRAIDLPHDSHSAMLAQIDAALAGPRRDDELRILAFFCEWSGQLAADLAGARGLSYPVTVRPIRLGCSTRLDPLHILWALHGGADGVFLGACPPGQCHYVTGNQHAHDRIANLQGLLQKSGFAARRLGLEWITPDDGSDLVAKLGAFVEQVRRLGPSPLRIKGV